MKGFIDEFKAFAMKGNVIDLAVAVVIGAAFGKIVASLVDNIVMPVVGIMLGGISFADLTYSLGQANITYGVFVQSVVDFLIIALVIFLVVKAINKAQNTLDGDEEEETAKPAEPSDEVKLLTEIRDNLKRQMS